MFQHFGVRWRLLIAFFGISAFAVIAAAAAFYSFMAVGSALDRITQERVPSALGSLEVSRQAERIAAAAPVLLAVTTDAQREFLSGTINAAIGRLEGLVSGLKSGEVDASALEGIEVAVRRLSENLSALNSLVADRLAANDRKSDILHKLSGTNAAAQRALFPGILVMDATFAQLRSAVDDPALSTEERAAVVSELTATISAALPLQKSQLEVSTINDTLVRAASAQTLDDLNLLSFPLRKTHGNLQRLVNEVNADVRELLLPRIDEFGGYVAGPNSILDIRSEELNLIASGEDLIRQNADLSRQLADATERLADEATHDIDIASLEAGSVQSFSTWVLIGVVALSLISSTLIVWLYVSRNLLARLTALSDSMLAIAGGNLEANLPVGGADEIGRMAEALTVFRDTAIEVKEASLREIGEARQRLREALESISEGFSLYDANDNLVLCNATYRELLYPGMEDFVVPGTPFAKIIRRAAEAGLIDDAQGRIDAWIAERLDRHRNPVGPQIQRRDGERWIQVNEIKTEDGGTVAVYSDITELKRRERELEEMDRLKSNFLSSVSHELRTPLTSVRGFAKLIARDFERRFMPIVGEDAKLKKQAERIGENLGIIIGEAERLTRLINDVLDISKIESGGVEWRNEAIDVRDMVNQAFNAASGQFSDKPTVQARLSVDDGLPPLRGDRDRLVQVLVNLLNNAAKFTDEGSVELKAGTTDDGWLRFAVIDTGAGIPAEEKDLVFDKFHQVTKSDTLEDKPKGTGLGLTICKQIIEHHEGRVWVESEPGKGSEFIFILPPEGRAEIATATTSEGSADRVAAAPKVIGLESKAPLIMAVDDDPAIRAYLSQLLDEEGYRVNVAESGSQAIELARAIRPDLITMDLMMPGVDGKTAIMEIRKDQNLRDVPIIVVSVLSDRVEAGADLSLGKPIDEANLLANIRHLLNRARQREEQERTSTSEHFLVLDLPDSLTQVPASAGGVNAISRCTVDEFEQRVRDGFDGMLVLPPESVRDLDLQRILETSKVRGVVISSSVQSLQIKDGEELTE